MSHSHREPERAPQTALHEVLEALSGAIYVHDFVTLHSTLINADRALALGYSSKALDGPEAPFSGVHPDDAPALLVHRQLLLESTSDDARTLEVRVRRANGGRSWTRLVERPVARDARGRVARIVGQAHDVGEEMAERQRIEGQLQETRRVEAMGCLAASVVHEFNNVLAAIMGSACLLERHLKDTEAPRRLASEIGAAANRGAEVARHLLALARTHSEPRETAAGRLR